MQVQVRFNEEGALRNQRYAFTSKYTLVSELMQNARRAGATRIDIWYDDQAKILRVADNGCGVDDFQKLLTFNESGWDEATNEKEMPFGVGFSKCLYAATRCIVVSGAWKIDFLTDDALARKPIAVEPVEVAAHLVGTEVELHGVDLPSLSAHVQDLCRGFATQVWFNGLEMPRPYAEDHISWMPVSIGRVRLAGLHDGLHSTRTLVFLQGFCVLQPGYYEDGRVNVVHLDPQRFVARLPDRDKLIDEGEERVQIDLCLRATWRKALLEAKTTLGSDVFVETFFEAMKDWGQLDLLDDVPVLPKALCRQIVGYPIQEGYESRDYLDAVEAAPTREDVEAGRVKLVDIDRVDCETAPLWMFARAKGYVVFSASTLRGDHWVHPHVRVLDVEMVRVEAVCEQCRSGLEGRWASPLVVLCEAVAITVDDERVEVTDEGVCDGHTLFIPKGETSGYPIRQVSSYLDEHDWFRGADLDADYDALAELIRRLRSVDPLATLNSLLRDLSLEKYPLLAGRTFKLAVGDTHDAHLVELLA